nr:tryptophan 7-halogenase [uncultured Sphingomonas sp.]
MSERPLRVVIVGRGIAGAMAAVHLARSLPPQAASLSVIGLPETPADPFGDIAASLPGFARWNARFGIDEAELVRQGCVSFSWGTAYSSWSDGAGTGFQPFGETGAPLNGVAFHQLAERLRQAGSAVRLSDYSVAAMAAQAGRFAYPSADPRSPLSLLDYGLHVDQPHYARLLLAQAERLDVAMFGPALRDVFLAPGGDIAGLVLEDGTELGGDLFLDASSTSAVLTGKLPASHWTSWSTWLPCNRSVTATSPSEVPPAPYAHVVAEAAGWRLVVPGRTRVAETIAHCSDDPPAFCGGQEHRFDQGRRELAWVGNCVALGQAATVLEPTAPFGLELLHRSLDRLAALFPQATPTEAERREYNRRFAEEADRARDVVIARYLVGGRQGAWWERLRQQVPPPELAAKLALFRSRGRIPLLDGDLLEEADWAALFDAQGERARRYDALADALPVADLQAQLARMRQAMIAAVAPMPLHGAFLDALVRKQAA